MMIGVLRFRSSDAPRLCSVSVAMIFAFVFAVLFVADLFYSGGVGEVDINKVMVFSKEDSPASIARKLLQSADGGGMDRIGTACSKNDIVIFQGPTASLPSGIPAFTVQILNVCVSGCSISNIHLSCGWFSSARLINPGVFKRLYYDDCLVNDGEALGPGQSLSFQYANSFRYPLSVSSVACC